MIKVVVWYALMNCGGGSAFPVWFLSEQAAEQWEESQDNGWGDLCTGGIETFEGSDVHRAAVENQRKLAAGEEIWLMITHEKLAGTGSR